jgi:hypothetical protein
MTDNTNSHQSESSNDNGLADLIRRIEAIYAARAETEPSPIPQSNPWIDKPGTLIAAERDVFTWEIVEKLQRLACRDIAHCENHRCRRGRRCSKLEELEPEMAKSRANLAAERAKWQPPAPTPEPRQRKKGRTGVRP